MPNLGSRSERAQKMPDPLNFERTSGMPDCRISAVYRRRSAVLSFHFWNPPLLNGRREGKKTLSNEALVKPHRGRRLVGRLFTWRPSPAEPRHAGGRAVWIERLFSAARTAPSRSPILSLPPVSFSPLSYHRFFLALCRGDDFKCQALDRQGFVQRR